MMKCLWELKFHSYVRLYCEGGQILHGMIRPSALIQSQNLLNANGHIVGHRWIRMLGHQSSPFEASLVANDKHGEIEVGSALPRAGFGCLLVEELPDMIENLPDETTQAMQGHAHGVTLRMEELNSVDQVGDNLFLGDKNAAHDLELIGKLKLTHIVTAELIPLPHMVSSTFPHLAILHIPIPDLPEADLLSHLDQTTRFIREGVEYGSVLVHCYHGMSRSAAIVVAFLMRTKHWKLEQALQHIRLSRACVFPNEGFLRQLGLYHRMRCRLCPTHKGYKFYKLQCVYHQVRQTKILPHQILSHPQRLASTPANGAGVEVSGSSRTYLTQFKCKKCRQTLVDQANVFPHQRGESLDWDQIGRLEETELRECRQGIFLEPLMWMGKVFSSALSEKLHCNKCNNKLGSYSWVGEVHCACGAGMKPGFVINLNRVDRCSMLKVVEADL
eukprot:snap_masked-scaffold78_size404448-processed-gene-3.19 protein:Tk10223 transcript:snap_masked-scaffold78_size404448-processed-gene-3.19-mRNA-1 annotation:"dual specificity protein phosphatase 12"